MGIDNYFAGTMIEKPREKADRIGINKLSDVELLALILETGNRFENVIEMSARLLFTRGGLKNLFTTDIDNLMTYGVKRGKAYRLLAIGELFKRFPNSEDDKILNTAEFFDYVSNIFFNAKSEKLVVCYLDRNSKVLRVDCKSDGNNSAVSLSTVEIKKTAILLDARYIYIAHNHPSGCLMPSKLDVITSEKVRGELKEISVLLTDSIIVDGRNYKSIFDDL